MIERDRSGILVPNGDVDALAAALVNLCSDRAVRDALGKAAAERMRHFTPERVIGEWQAAIGEVLEMARRKVER
jgi:glycosyltransferase involved in cell wall biosynthesis